MSEGLQWRRKLDGRPIDSHHRRLTGHEPAPALERLRAWLLAQVIRDEIAANRNLREEHDEAMGRELGEDVDDPIRWPQQRIHVFQHLALVGTLTPTTDTIVARGLGPQGQPGDPAFVVDLASRRVQILGSTPHPDEAFMCQLVRNLTLVDAAQGRVLICDRDAQWRRAVRARLQDAGIRVVQTPYRAPNANAYAERFVRSIREECLNRLIPLGEQHHRRAISEFIAHDHRERNHQGLDNELIESEPAEGRVGRVWRHPRLGGLLNYYARAA